MTSANDSFTRANEAPVTTPWVSVTPLGGLNLTSNALVGVASAARASLYNSGTWGNDQRVDGIIGALSASNNYPELWVRGSTGGNGYKVYTDGTTGGTAIARVDAGVEITIQAVAVAFANGDKFGIGIVGSTITLYKNDVAQTPTATDATYASGLPGAGAYGAGTIDEWTATDGAGGDTTAPTLSSPTGTAASSSTATGTVSTDEGNGTAYAVVTTSATAPSVAQVQAGQNHAGAAAAWAGSQAVSSTGTKTFNATGLAPSTTYWFHYQHRDAASNDSAVVSSASFVTGSGFRPYAARNANQGIF